MINRQIFKNDKRINIIAEIGGNHNGDARLARDMIDAAKDAGADAVKFQVINPDAFLPRDHPARPVIERERLSDNDFQNLRAHAEDCGIIFLATVFDPRGADFVEGLHVTAFKIASCDLNNTHLLEHVCRKKLPIILSTGASTIAEVEASTGHMRRAIDFNDFVLLHCSVGYPAKDEEMNLTRIEALKPLGFPVGCSDHSTGIEIAVAAMGMDICVLEKHFTIDRALPGGDNGMSMLPDEMKALTTAAGRVGRALQKPAGELTETEIKLQPCIRRSIFSSRPIATGQKIGWDDLVLKRPGTGMPPEKINDVRGRTARNDIAADLMIEPNLIT